MAGHRKCVVLILYCIIVNSSYCIGSKLNVPKLLLPYNSEVATNFTLEASEGCFTWQSTRPEIASVKPQGSDDPSACSRHAIVTAVSRIPARKTTIVIAEDPETGQQLRCDVIIDNIVAVEIETTTKELYLDDSPEEFVLRASNDKGDIFSSLDGMTFDWNLVLDSEAGNQDVGSPNSVLRLLKFSESSYTALPHIKPLEDQGKRGDRILMKGLHTGTAIVTVKPMDPVYKDVPESRVRIMVVANLQLSPSLVYILQHSTVAYKVELLKQGKSQEVEMPSPIYYLELDNKTVGSLDVSTSVVTGLQFGNTELRLKGQNAQLAGIFREPTAGIYVVNPGYLEFSIHPRCNWMLETKRIYTISINIFDKTSNRIYPSDNVHVKAEFPANHFKVLSSSRNGTYHIVETILKGSTTLLGELVSVVMADGKEFQFSSTVEGSQHVEIFDPIVVKPKRVILPWNPMGDPAQYQLTATGGSGNYSWRSGNTSFATVTAPGSVKTSGDLGSTVVTALDVRNSALFDVAEVLVTPPTRIAFLPNRVEAEIGTMLRIPIALFGQQNNTEVNFDRCDSVLFDTPVSDASIFKNILIREPSSVNEGCADVILEARNVGHVVLFVVYEQHGIKLQSQIDIAAYKPLTLVDPSEIAIITPGSSRYAVFEGGPMPWVLDESKYYRTVGIPEKSDVVRNSKVEWNTDAVKHQHLFHIHCEKFGEEIVNLTVGNGPTAKNKHPASSAASVRIGCEDPKGLRLLPLINYPKGRSPCPISADVDDPVPVPHSKPITMVLTLTDRLGRKFDNFSSLMLDWSLSSDKLGLFDTRRDAKQDVLYEYHKQINPLGVVGQLTVTVQISRYSDAYSSYKVSPPITKYRILSLLDYPSISPSQVSIYNHARIKGVLEIDQGSGFFNLSHVPHPSDMDIATIDYNSATFPRKISIIPVTEGSVTISVRDLCLFPTQSTTSTIYISEIAAILLDVADKVPLNGEIIATLSVLDSNGQKILSEYYPLMNLQPKSGSDIISLRLVKDKNDVDNLSAKYVVYGAALGRTTLMISALNKKNERINSAAVEIQVYAPLKLEPKDITIISGTQFQILAEGGPHPESTIEFSFDNSTVGNISRDGLITALNIGKAVVTGRAVGRDSHEKDVVYSEDTATVRVVDIMGIKIIAPTRKLQSGTQMPLYAVGVAENVSPFAFGNACSLRFQWSISSEQVAKLKHPFHQNGLVESELGSFSMRLLASDPGHVTVKLVVSFEDGRPAITDSITVQVFERFKVIAPTVIDSPNILMTPNTEMSLKTNKDGSAAKIQYTVLRDPSKQASPAVVNVSSSGVVTSHMAFGSAVLQVEEQEESDINQTLGIAVRVKPLTYLMINPTTIVYSKSPRVTCFPVGMQLDFTVSFHDNEGVMFSAVTASTKFRLNKYGNIQLMYGQQNFTLVAKVTRPDFTILKVWDKYNPHIVDYIGIPVSPSVYPSDLTVIHGSIICFSSELVSKEGLPGEWMTVEGSSVSVNRSSGLAVAESVGKSYILYNVSSLTAKAEVTVVPIRHIYLKFGSLEFITTVPTKHSQFFRVKITDEKNGGRVGLYGSKCGETVRDAQLHVDKLPFRCEANFDSVHTSFIFNDIFKVQAMFDYRMGRYICQVESKVLMDSEMESLSTFETMITARAVPIEETRAVSEVLQVPFYPHFFIHDTIVTLTVENYAAEVKISGIRNVLRNLQLTSRNEMIVHDDSIPVNLNSIGGIWRFLVKLDYRHFVDGKYPSSVDVEIDVKCNITGQAGTIMVHIPKGDKFDLGTYELLLVLLNSYYESIIFIIFALFIGVTIMFVRPFFSRSRQEFVSDNSAAFIPPAQQQPGFYNNTPAYRGGSPNAGTRLWSVNGGPYTSPTAGNLSRRSQPSPSGQCH